MDLSLESWDYDVATENFSTEEELTNFVSDCQPLMDQVTNSNDHDRFTYFIDFYRKFKAQSSSLYDFFGKYDPKDYPTENRPDCIGRALTLKSILERARPELKDKLYVASNTFDYMNLNRKMTKELEDNYHYYVSYNEHCVLTLKFEMEGRTGFILYEMSFLNVKPIIVMEDNKSPTYTKVSLPKGRNANYRCVGGKYVEVSFYPDEGADTSINGIDELTLALFVGGSFKRLDISASFCLLPNIQYAYSIREGKLVANFSHYGDDKFYNFQRWDANLNDVVKCKIPLTYFLQEERNEKFESEFREIVKLLPYEESFLRKSLGVISKIQTDKDFLNQLFDLPLAMKDNRKIFVNTINTVRHF